MNFSVVSRRFVWFASKIDGCKYYEKWSSLHSLVLKIICVNLYNLLITEKDVSIRLGGGAFDGTIDNLRRDAIIACSSEPELHLADQ